MPNGKANQDAKAWKQIIEDHCNNLYGGSKKEAMELNKEMLKCLKEAALQGEKRISPNINHIIETRAALINGKAPGHNSMVAEMLKALSPAYVYVIAWHFARRMVYPESSKKLQ